MAHGAPDWWGRSPKTTTFTLEDMAELAARLGSIVTFDRRGDVMLVEDFDQALTTWEEAHLGSGNEIYPVCWPTQRGGIAIQLKTAPTAGNVCEIVKVFPSPVLKPIGVEVAFSPEADAEIIEINILLFDGSTVYRYYTRYNLNTGNVSVYHSDGTMKVVGTPGAIRTGYGHFAIMKTVVDLLAGKYVRVIFNNHVYDSSAYEPYSEADSTPESMTIRISNYTPNGVTSIFTIDDVIVTQNEPV